MNYSASRISGVRQKELDNFKSCYNAVYTNMESLLNKKRAKRALLVNYATKVQTELNSEIPAPPVRLERYLNEINRRVRAVNDIHETIAEQTEESEVESLVIEQEDWLQNQMSVVDSLNELLTSLRSSVGVNVNAAADQNTAGSSVSDSDITDSRSTSSIKSGIKLTKLDLATFDGNDVDMFDDYREDHFTNVYSNKDLSGTTKMSYLRRTLKGDAYRMISGFKLNEE